MVTKNWRKELYTKQTENYTISIYGNLSTGCPRSEWNINKDSIIFINAFLPDIIKALLEKSESRVEFVNMKIQKEMRFDISFYPHVITDVQTSRDSLLNILAHKIRFTISSDSILNKVYSIKINDSDRLEKHLDNSDRSTVKWPKDEIEFYGCTLYSIFTALENGMEILIDYNQEDTNNYKTIVPRDNISNLVAYFKNECGIEFLEDERNVEITKIIFSDIK